MPCNPGSILVGEHWRGSVRREHTKLPRGFVPSCPSA